MSIETLPSTVLRAGLIPPPPRTRGSERRRSEELPAVALAQLGCLALGHRCEAAACPLLLFDQPACLGRSIEKQHASGFRAGALPGMRHAARHEGAGAGTADRDLIADLEGHLAAQDIGHLVAVAMQVERALGPGGNGLLEHHDAVAGFSAPRFEREQSAWRNRVLSRRYNDVRRVH